jgi:hypothetical protein
LQVLQVLYFGGIANHHAGRNALISAAILRTKKERKE